MSKRTTRHSMYLAAKVVVLGLFLAIVIFPFYWILITSFKQQKDLFRFPPQFWPDPAVLDNYVALFQIGNFGRYFINTTVVSLVGAFGAVLVGMFGAYILARYPLKAKKQVLFFYLMTQMIPGFIGLAPLYTLLNKLGMIDRLPTLMLIYMVGLIPYCTITLRGFFSQAPVSLEEAAMIDGCNQFESLFRVIVPIIMPGLSATFIFSFVQCWNNLFPAIMYMNMDYNYTLPVALNSMVLKNDVRWGELSAGAVVSIVPTIIMFGFVQRYVAEGLASGAVKG